MKTLKNQFNKNGLRYYLIQRNEVVAMYGISGTFTDNILHYEVCRIHIRNDQYGHREVLPSNEQFGKDGSMATNLLHEAIKYFYELTNSIKLNGKAQNEVKSGEESLWGSYTIPAMVLSTSGS